MRSDHAVLLRNAFFDTSDPTPPNIPSHLRAEGDPGSFVIQARGLLDDAFRDQLRAAGATILSYIPNNAYHVRVSAEGAARLRALPQTQNVLAWEPYYKLELQLLPPAVHQTPLPEGTRLNVLVFPGEREAGLQAMKALGVEVLGEDRSPFGHQLFVQAPPDSLPALARLPIVNQIELRRARQPANDLTRIRTGIATNTATAFNHLGLTGQDVMVNVNDTGVEETHPDLQGRVFGTAIADPDGHGTHVAGTIISSGLNGPAGGNVSGSATNASFRGIATNAAVFALPIDLLTGPLISDAYLQQTAARTNVFISNNSWGYPGSFDYDLASASYDAAVRDALPDQTGPRPLLYVFAAGNSGNGDSSGKGGLPGSVTSPGTAKNVITVGAIEQFRGITNVIVVNGQTNSPFLPDTDSQNQVIEFSSRGNVGIGVEGLFGRFKPDLVAPGSFTVSCRSSTWMDPTANMGAIVNRLNDQVLSPGQTNVHTIFIPGNASELRIRTVPNNKSPDPFPPLSIYVNPTMPPNLASDFVGLNDVTVPVTSGTWFYTIGNTNPFSVNFDLQTVIVTTNAAPEYFAELKNLNDKLAPDYRYESGTSQSTPVVSGILALLQEMFEQRLSLTNSPALMKALLISGARSVGTLYNLQVQSGVNYQGWGLVNLSNSLPAAMGGGAGSEATWPIAFIDENPTHALATGQSHRRTLQLPLQGQAYGLRITLVWTDPPGNPAASLKLVNDLDLIVTNTFNGEYYVGNNILQGSDFNVLISPTDTNPPPFDVVNNVENVFINGPVSDGYDIVVRARRVNVNAVTTQTDGVLQDYALVIASANSRITNAITSLTPAPAVPALPGYDPSAVVRTLSNTVPLLEERVGANNPLLPVLNNGVTNQWNFYVFNNSFSTNTNVAFVTFLSPNLSRSRLREGDIDLYVSTDPSLTNLDATVVDLCTANITPDFRSSRTRGGTELVILPNAPTGPTANYYVGIKSEDQQGVSFGLITIATDRPFDSQDENGNYQLNFYPTRVEVPDGSPDDPGGVQMIAVVGSPPEVMVRRIVLTNGVTHEQFGDLLGDFRHDNTFATLNNHRSFDSPQALSEIFIYDDSGEDDVLGSRHTDGPGSLRGFTGEPAFGVWTFTMIDNTPFHSGTVDILSGLIEPEQTTNYGNGAVVLTVQPGKWKYRTADVPPGVTNLLVFVRQRDQLPLDLYVRFGDFPDMTTFDKYARIDPPGGQLSLGLFDLPPLQPGRYYFGVFNPNSTAVTFTNFYELQYDLTPLRTTTYLSGDTPTTLIDDAITNSIITVTNTDTIVDLTVGVRIDHPRLSDLSLHLVSPQGTRLLLAENRGGPLATNYGTGVPLTNVVPVTSSGGPTQDVLVITNTVNSGVIRIDYDFFVAPDDLSIYYDGERIFDSGLRGGAGTFQVQFGPGVSTNITVILNEGGNPNSTTVWEYTATITGPWNYATFTESATRAGLLKFSLPPYSTDPTNIVVLTNSFENALATNYSFLDPVLNRFENWSVLSNGVAVLTDTNLAFEGTNLLALSNGKILLPLPNVLPDHDYLLSFAYRKVSSSPTQSLSFAVPSDANIFRRLQVTMPPPGGADAVAAPKVRLCPSQKITLIADTSCIVTGITCTGPEGELTKPPFQGLPVYSLLGCWSHSPKLLDSNTVAGLPFYVGTNTQFRAPPEPGDYYLFLGINDNDFLAAPGASTSVPVSVYWEQCQWSSAEALLGTTPIPLEGDFAWRTKRVRFTGNPTTTNLTLRADINSTMLFDAIHVMESIQSIFYLPEETMRPFQGELAQGDWKLELWDTRFGPVSSINSGTLLSWTLNFTFGNGPPTRTLTNGFPYSDIVRGGEIRYFVVNVPREVTAVRNFLVSAPGNVELLYHRFGLPTGSSPPDDVGPLGQPVNLLVTTTTPSGAELRPGQRYFLGVRNVNPNETNGFTLRATFNTPVINLANGVPVRSVLPPNPHRSKNWTDSLVAVTNMQYYRFLVDTTNGLSATFTVTPLPVGSRGVPGDVNLVLRRVLPVVDHFPRPNFFDYESTACFADRETIFLNSHSLPIPLQAGAWYLGVYNMDTNNVGYEIQATLSTNSLLYTVSNLVNGVAVPFVASRFSTNTVFYRLLADQTNAAGLFEICAMNGDADLLLKRGDLPSPDLYDFSYLLTAADAEPICLRTNIFIPDLNATNWYMAVVLRPPTSAVSGEIRASVLINNMCTPCDGVTLFPPAPLPEGGIALQWSAVPGENYEVDWSVDLKTWTPIGAVTATTATAAYKDDKVSPLSSSGFYRVRQVSPR